MFLFLFIPMNPSNITQRKELQLQNQIIFGFKFVHQIVCLPLTNVHIFTSNSHLFIIVDMLFCNGFCFCLDRTCPAACGCSLTACPVSSTWSCSSSVLWPTMDRLVFHIPQEPLGYWYGSSLSRTEVLFFSLVRVFCHLRCLVWTNIWLYCHLRNGKEHLLSWSNATL